MSSLKRSRRIPWLTYYPKIQATVVSVFIFHLESLFQSGLIKHPNISVMLSICYYDQLLTLQFRKVKTLNDK